MTVNKGKISAIIPVYNAEKYLAQAIESIIEQSYISWEMFLVVSESEDRSVEIAEKYSREYDNIYLIIAEDRGIGCARNRGLEKSKGEYILFMDADDYLPDREVFRRYINIADKINSDIVVSNYARLWNEKLLPATSHSEFSRFERDSEEFRFRGFFSVGTLSYVWGKLYRKSFLDQNRITFSEYPYAEDKLFNMQCYICGARYAFRKECGYVYRKNDNSVSFQYHKDSNKCWIGIAETLKQWIEKQKKDPESYMGLVYYTILFAAFFDGKMEYQRRKSIWAIRKILRIYGRDPFGRECFMRLACEKKRVSQLNQKIWRIIIKGFSRGMKWKCYLALSFGIKQLIEQRVDEKLSDTGLRE